jgi:probable HAF family extracellular repeat protein
MNQRILVSLLLLIFLLVSVLIAQQAFTTIDDPHGIATEANGINGGGQIVGLYLDSNGFSHGFSHANGAFTTIDDPNQINTYVYGINGTGQIVGAYDNISGTHGFLYKNGVFTTIDDPNAISANGGTTAMGINDAGQIVGSYGDKIGGHGYVAGAVRAVPNPPTMLSPKVQ